MPTLFNCFKAFLVLFIFHQSAFSQQENSYWYFGEYASIDFSAGEPVVLSDGNLSTWEGCAAVSTSSGELLFYTDGLSVFNKNHETMLNGNGLLGDPSSTQSSVIAPQPANPDLCYIFTIDDVDQDGGVNGLNYSKIDMTLDDNLGGILTDEKNLNLSKPMCEKLTAVKHANGVFYWVISHKWGTNDFYAYLITSDGVNTTPVISGEGLIIGGTNIDVTKGYLKASPDGRKLARANAGLNSVEVFDFNPETGVVSNGFIIPDLEGEPYGIEFSPNGKYLYVNTWKYNPGQFLWQYDLEAGDPEEIINSEFEIAIGTEGALQLAPDGRIYIAKAQTHNLSRINQPNEKGENCEFMTNAVFLEDATCMWGLPNTISWGFDTTVRVNQNKITTNRKVIFLPNPIQDELKILFPEVQHDKVTIDFFNLSGQMIKREFVSSNRLEVVISTEEFGNGFYMAKISKGNRIVDSRKNEIRK